MAYSRKAVAEQAEAHAEEQRVGAVATACKDRATDSPISSDVSVSGYDILCRVLSFFLYAQS